MVLGFRQLGCRVRWVGYAGVPSIMPLNTLLSHPQGFGLKGTWGVLAVHGFTVRGCRLRHQKKKASGIPLSGFGVAGILIRHVALINN